MAGIAGGIIVLAVILVAVFAPVIAPHNPQEQDIIRYLQPPAWLSGNWGYPLGTDVLGRDILSRVIHGARTSLLVGISAVALSGSMGVALGLCAGYFGGGIDAAIMRIGDIQLGIPALILAVALAAAVGPGTGNVIIILGITGWVTYARVVRGEVLAVRENEYIHAAILLGAPIGRILLRHVLPNVSTSIIVLASMEVARMILAEASLGYLGLGVQPPAVTWGGIIADGRDYLETGWWVAVAPGLAVMVTVLGINLLGDELRDMLDPTLH